MAKRILIVDDDVGFAETLQFSLEAESYDVRVETDSTQAVASAREFHPDVVLLDLVMPSQDGGTVAVGLQYDRGLGTIPIIFLTGMLPQNSEREMAGRTVLGKPLHCQDLVACIEKHLARAAHSS